MLRTTLTDGINTRGSATIIMKRTLGDIMNTHESFSYPVTVEAPKKLARRKKKVCWSDQQNAGSLSVGRTQEESECGLQALHLKANSANYQRWFETDQMGLPNTMETFMTLEAEVRLYQPRLLQHVLDARHTAKLEAQALISELWNERKTSMSLLEQNNAQRTVLLQLQAQVIQNGAKLREIENEERTLLMSLAPPSDEVDLTFPLEDLYAEAWPDDVSAPSA